MKHICHHYALGITAMFIFLSCGGGDNKSDASQSSSYVPKYDRRVRGNIELIKTSPWNKKQYIDIRDNQIPKMEGRKKQTECLKLLKLNACLSMEKELAGLMQNKCGSNHSKLSALYKELTSSEFKDIDTGDLLHVRADYAVHQKLARQIAKHSMGQEVTSYTVKYNKDYDTSTEKESRTLYNNNKRIADRCSYLKNGLTNISFRERHKKYCESVVSFYERVSFWSVAEENIIQARLHVFEKELGNTDEWRDWNDRINAVKAKYMNRY